MKSAPIVVICILAAAACFADGRADFFSTLPKDLMRFLPQRSEAVVTSVSQGGAISISGMPYVIVADREAQRVSVRAGSAYYDFEYTLDAGLRILDGFSRFKGAQAVALAGSLRIDVTAADAGKALGFAFQRSDGKRAEKRIAYDAATIPTDILGVTLQALLNAGRRESFSGNTVIEEQAAVLPVSYKVSETADPLSLCPQFSLPGSFRAFLASQGRLVVYEMSLRGLAGLFAPYKYYYAFSMSPPYMQVAYWGGLAAKLDYIQYAWK